MNDALSIPGVLMTEDGKVRFTRSERPRIARLFARCGVNIDTVKTVAQYIEARQQAASFFNDWIASEIASGEASAERELLLKILRSVD